MLRGVGEKLKVDDLRQPHGCAYTLYLAKRWKQRAAKAKRTYDRWVAHFVVADIRYTPGSNAWRRAVSEVQKVYPGTASWLLSCSDAEGGWGRWVSYGGLYGPEYAAAHYVVGGWMQFKYPTFSGMIRRAIDNARERGFHLPAGLTGIEGWTSPIAQALAAGWARATGNDASHWSASWNNGC